MKILTDRYYGMIARCNACGCVIGYGPEDVSNTQNISCPKCRFTMWVPFNPTYDGVIREEHENGDTMVSEQSGSGKDNSTV